jgi:hypothetical protein
MPLLVGGALMPEATELPENLRTFSFCNAANIDSGQNFDTDIERLMRSMDRLFEGDTANTCAGANLDRMLLQRDKRPATVVHRKIAEITHSTLLQAGLALVILGVIASLVMPFGSQLASIAPA